MVLSEMKPPELASTCITDGTTGGAQATKDEQWKARLKVEVALMTRSKRLQEVQADVWAALAKHQANERDHEVFKLEDTAFVNIEPTAELRSMRLG